MFNGILGGNKPDLDQVAETARQTQLYANLKALEFKEFSSRDDVPGLDKAIIGLGALDNPNVIGTVLLGYNHFVQELSPYFQKYVMGLVSTATSAKDLHDKLLQLQAQHNHLFNCQVVPGFSIEYEAGEIPHLNAWVAQIVVSIAAASLRNIELWNAVSQKFGIRGRIELIKSWFRKREHGSDGTGLARRGRWDDNIATTEDYFLALGYAPPLLPSLKTHLVNWVGPSFSSPDIGPAEFSSLTRNRTSPITVTRTLGNTSITLVSSTLSSPSGHGPLDDLVASVGLVPSSSTLTNMSLIPSVNQSVVIIGPILLIWPNNVELMPLRHFQISGNNTNATPTSTTNESISLTPEQSAIASAVNGSSFAGFATTAFLKPANPRSASLFYRQASLSVKVIPAIFGLKGKSLVLVDLLSGNVLNSTMMTDPTDAEKTILHVDLEPGAGGGMWEGGFKGGGVYGIGIMGADGKLVRTLPSSGM